MTLRLAAGLPVFKWCPCGTEGWEDMDDGLSSTYFHHAVTKEFTRANSLVYVRSYIEDSRRDCWLLSLSMRVLK